MKEDAMKHVACMGDNRDAYTVLVGKHDRNIRLGWPRFRWKGNIRTDRKLLGLESVYWICLAQDWDNRQACANTAVKILVSYKAGNLLNRRRTLSSQKDYTARS